MNAKLYYQDFRLNATSFTKEDLILIPEKAVFIKEFSLEEASKAMDIPECLMRKEDIPGAIWTIMNNIIIPPEHKDRKLFEEAGHTCMSVGDYIEFEDGEIWIAAMCGWKVILPE